jgi:Uma2 family endonuclease
VSITTDKAITLEEFLKLPETKPASEYINAEIIQKPMPKGKHSRLQFRLCNTINDVAEPLHIASAFPELRCSFGIRSIVPDVAVFKWSRIPFDAEGEPPNDFLLCPDWTIEILSPEQSSNRVIGNILYCLQHGCQLGWLIANLIFLICIIKVFPRFALQIPVQLLKTVQPRPQARYFLF